MSDLRELYQEVILDHYRSPRNHTPIADATAQADGHNPLCGDRVRVSLTVENGVIRDIGFEGDGCAISTASASLMTEAVKGMAPADAERLFLQFQALVMGTDGAQAPGDLDSAALGKLEVLAGVRDYPVRVKCATLAWHTLQSALAQDNDTNDTPSTVTTEA